jgi:hypothetical protein
MRWRKSHLQQGRLTASTTCNQPRQVTGRRISQLSEFDGVQVKWRLRLRKNNSRRKSHPPHATPRQRSQQSSRRTEPVLLDPLENVVSCLTVPGRRHRAFAGQLLTCTLRRATFQHVQNVPDLKIQVNTKMISKVSDERAKPSLRWCGWNAPDRERAWGCTAADSNRAAKAGYLAAEFLTRSIAVTG